MSVPAPAPNMPTTNRQDYEMVTSDALCQTCHNVINPIGFVFEHYDTFGRYQELDRNLPIDPSGKFGTATFAGPHELLDYLVANFGPDSTPRAVLMDQPLAVDEDALAKAMWVEYTVADPTAANGQNRWIQEPYFDRQGNVWLTERTRGAGGITRLDPRTATFTKFPTPKPTWSPHGLAVDPVDGSVWWGGRDIHLGRLDPATGAMKPYPAPGPGRQCPRRAPWWED